MAMLLFVGCDQSNVFKDGKSTLYGTLERVLLDGRGNAIRTNVPGVPSGATVAYVLMLDEQIDLSEHVSSDEMRMFPGGKMFPEEIQVFVNGDISDLQKYNMKRVKVTGEVRCVRKGRHYVTGVCIQAESVRPTF